MNRQDGSRKANLPVAHVRHARLQAIISVEFRGFRLFSCRLRQPPAANTEAMSRSSKRVARMMSLIIVQEWVKRDDPARAACELKEKRNQSSRRGDWWWRSGMYGPGTWPERRTDEDGGMMIPRATQPPHTGVFRRSRHCNQRWERCTAQCLGRCASTLALKRPRQLRGQRWKPA